MGLERSKEDMSIVEQILDILLAGLTEVPMAIGQGLNDAMKAMFLDANNNLSTFAYVILAFGGVALALSLTKLVFHIIRSKIG